MGKGSKNLHNPARRMKLADERTNKMARSAVQASGAIETLIGGDRESIENPDAFCRQAIYEWCDGREAQATAMLRTLAEQHPNYDIGKWVGTKKLDDGKMARSRADLHRRYDPQKIKGAVEVYKGFVGE